MFSEGQIFDKYPYPWDILRRYLLSLMSVGFSYFVDIRQRELLANFCYKICPNLEDSLLQTQGWFILWSRRSSMCLNFPSIDTEIEILHGETGYLLQNCYCYFICPYLELRQSDSPCSNEKYVLCNDGTKFPLSHSRIIQFTFPFSFLLVLMLCFNWDVKVLHHSEWQF